MTWQALFARDSLIWQILFYIGLIATGLSVISDPSTYGIPASVMPYIRLIALIAAILGGKMGLSWAGKAPDGQATGIGVSK